MDSGQNVINKLQQQFDKIDSDGDGIILENELRKYLETKKISFNSWHVKEMMNVSKNKVNKSRFVTFMLANELNLCLPFAFMQFELQKNIENYMDANPPQLQTDLKTSSVKFILGDKKEKERSFGISIGVNKNKQTQNKAFIQTLLGRQLSTVWFLIQMKANNKAEQISIMLQSNLNQIKQIGMQLDQTLSKFLKYLTITSKFHNDKVFIILEIKHPLFQIIGKTIDSFVMMTNPNCQALLHAQITSSMFDTIITKGLNTNDKQLQVDIGFQIDDVSLNKFKRIINQESSQGPPLLILTFLQELHFQTKFNKIQEILQYFGIEKYQFDVKDKLSFLKDLNIAEILSSFLPDSYQTLQIIKQNCQAEGQISLQIHDIYTKISFKLNVEGAFDLIL